MHAGAAQQGASAEMEAGQRGIVEGGHSPGHARKRQLAVIVRQGCLHLAIILAAMLLWNMTFYLGRLIPVFYFYPLVLWLFVSGVACMLIGIVALVAALFRGRNHRGAAYLTLVSTYAVAAFFGKTWLVWSQEDDNQRRGRILGQAIIRFREDRGQYPTDLDELKPKYVERVPRYWFGVFRLRYSYGLHDRTRVPYLWYYSHPASGVSYDVQADKWSYSTW